jgi:hypothetical protein
VGCATAQWPAATAVRGQSLLLLLLLLLLLNGACTVVQADNEPLAGLDQPLPSGHNPPLRLPI